MHVIPLRPDQAAAPEADRVVAFRPEFVALTGSYEAAILLSQLVYWFTPDKGGKTRLRVRHNNRLLYSRSNPMMMADTGLGKWPLRRARERLLELGLVQSEVHLFGSRTMPHWWVDMARVARLCDSGFAYGRQTGRAHGCETGLAPPCATLYKSKEEEVSKDKHAQKARVEEAGDGTGGIAEEACLKFDIDVVDEGEEADMGVRYANAGAQPAMTAAQVSAKLAGPKAAGKISAGVLAGLWKRHEFDRTGQFQKAWTGKDLGQAGQLTRALGDRAWPVVQWALSNWAALTFEAKSVKGKGGAPSEPSLGWLLQYHDVAVRMWTQATLPQTGRISYAQAAAMAPVQSIATPQPTEQAASADEAKAALALLTNKAGP